MTDFEKLTETEIELLKNFQDMIDSLWKHERYVFRLARHMKRLRLAMKGRKRKPVDEAYKEVEGTIKALKSEILSKFDVLGPKNSMSDEEKIIIYERGKRHDLINMRDFLKKAYDQLFQKEILIKNKKTVAERKIGRALTSLKKDLQQEERGLTVNEHIFLLIEKLHEFRGTLYDSINLEHIFLKDIGDIFMSKMPKADKIEKLEDIEGKLRVSISNIKKQMRTEKSEVYKPLIELIGEEISGEHAFIRLKERRKKDAITWEDIKSDIYTMTDTFEINEYLSALRANKELIEERALPHIELYKIKTSEIIERLRKESVLDPLTLLFTRKMMDAQLDNLIFSSQDKKDSFSIIIIDIDNFKSVNDDLGHIVGDNVLVSVARRIKSKVRPSDIICRYGGEEFIIILPRTKEKIAVEKAEEVRLTIEQFDFELEYKRRITISAGVAGYDGKAEKKEFIATADAKLYKAKTSGKNQVNS